MLKDADQRAAKQLKERKAIAQRCFDAQAAGKAPDHMSAFPSYENFLPQVVARREEAKKEKEQARQKRKRPQHTTRRQHNKHTKHTNGR